ncbi:MAG: (2Fe-2S) ferredoxin domain-containing protein [Mariprofundaceae bacterium]
MIQICHGQNCRDVGGQALTDKLQDLAQQVEIIPCQGLCSYAPTARVDNIAILNAKLDQLLEHPSKQT